MENPDHYARAFLSVAATFAELEAEIKRDNIREGIAASRAQGKWHGRPPFGFDVGSEGYLTPNEDYDTAVVIIDELDKGTSKRELARRAGITLQRSGLSTTIASDTSRVRSRQPLMDSSATHTLHADI